MRTDRFKCRLIGAGAVSTNKALSLRAQRSNPDCLRGNILDCFVASAPRNDGVAVGARYTLSVVMPGLDPGIHASLRDGARTGQALT